MTTLEVIRTFLELGSPKGFRPGRAGDARTRTERMEECPASFYRYLYAEVGRRYCWIDRVDWTDEQIHGYLEQPAVGIWLMTYAGAPAGFFELRQHSDGSAEIVYLGLLQEFISRGLGKLLLSAAVEAAWALGANRIWLQTCSLDDPAALPNYLKRGFQIVRHETYLLAGGRCAR